MINWSKRIPFYYLLAYAFLNWIVLCVAYPIVVHPDPYIGIVYFITLICNGITLAGLIVLNKWILARYLKNDLLYYSVLFLLSFLLDQASYWLLVDKVPMLDLDNTSNAYYKGENMLFTVSSAISSSLVFGIAYLKRLPINNELKQELR